MGKQYGVCDTEYVKPEQLDVLTQREKATRHLKTWSKAKLIQHCLNASKIGWIDKWADEYEGK